MEIDEKVKIFLFTRWMGMCYSDVLNTKDGYWYLDKMKYFENVIIHNYIMNGTYQNAVNFIHENY